MAIESNNLVSIKQWLHDNTQSIRKELRAELSDKTLQEANRQLIEVGTLNGLNLEVASANGVSTRYKLLAGVQNELNRLGLSADLERARNVNLYDLEILRGQIDREMATLEGQLKGELAGLSGENLLTITQVENQGKLKIAHELAPIEREGKVKIARVQGENDLEVAVIDGKNKVALAGMRGDFDVSMSVLDAQAIEAQTVVDAGGIDSSAQISVAGIANKSKLSADFILQGARLTADSTREKAVQEVRFIAQNSRLKTSYEALLTQADIEALNQSAQQSATQTLEVSALTQQRVQTVTQQDIDLLQIGGFLNRTYISDRSAVTIEGILNSANQDKTNTINAAQNEVLVLSAEGELKVAHANAGTDLDILNETNRGIIERGTRSDYAHLQADFNVSTALNNAANQAILDGVITVNAKDLAAIRIGANAEVGAINRDTRWQEALNDLLNKSSLNDQVLLAQSLVSAVENEGVRLEAKAAIATDTLRTGLGIASDEALAKLSINADKTIRANTISNADAKTTQEIAYKAEAANITVTYTQEGQQQRQSAILGTSLLNDSKVRHNADTSFEGVKARSDEAHQGAIDNAASIQFMSAAFSQWARDYAQWISGIKVDYAYLLAAKGQNRRTISYNISNKSSTYPDIERDTRVPSAAFQDTAPNPVIFL